MYMYIRYVYDPGMGGRDIWGNGKGNMFHCYLISWLIIPDAGCPNAGYMGEPVYIGAMWVSRHCSTL